MIIEVFMTFHVILCFAIITIIYFSKPDSSGLSSFVFKPENRSSIRFRPVTKVIFVMVIAFFANSLFLNKLINKESKISTIGDKIEQKQIEEKKNVGDEVKEKTGVIEKTEEEKENNLS